MTFWIIGIVVAFWIGRIWGEEVAFHKMFSDLQREMQLRWAAERSLTHAKNPYDDEPPSRFDWKGGTGVE